MRSRARTGYLRGIVDGLVPVIYEDGRRAEFCWKDDNPIVQVVPAHGEPVEAECKLRHRGRVSSNLRQGRIHEAFSKLNVTTRNGKIGNHFAQGNHDRVCNCLTKAQ